MVDDVIPFSDEKAKAIQKTFEFGSDAIHLVRDAAGFLREIFGTVPEDLVGIIGADWLKCKRYENFHNICQATNERLKERGVNKTEEVSPSLAIPLLRAVADESRAELQDMWARLLAAARDPTRSRNVRQSFIDIIKRMDPMDAIVFIKLSETVRWDPSARDYFAMHFNVTADEIEISFENLTTIGLARPDLINPYLTTKGRELMRLLRD